MIGLSFYSRIPAREVGVVHDLDSAEKGDQRESGFALRRRTRVRISVPVVRVGLGLHGFTQLPREFIGILPLRPLRAHPPRRDGGTA